MDSHGKEKRKKIQGSDGTWIDGRIASYVIDTILFLLQGSSTLKLVVSDKQVVYPWRTFT